MATTDTHATIEELLDAVFSVWSVPKPYTEDQLPLRESPETEIRRVGGWCEITASQWGRKPGSKGPSTGEDTAD
jgi:hypothetical protein